MKQNIFILGFLLCYTFGNAAIYDSPAFKIQDKSIFSLYESSGKTIFSNDTLLLLECKSSISGLAISGKTTLKNEEAIVRVLLIDMEGKEYLVFEDMYLFPEEKEHVFTDFAMETAILENIIPREIKIFIQNAQIELSRITGVQSKEKVSIYELAEIRKNILLKQEELIIDQWNRVNSQTGQFWIAGKTSVSGLPYSDKKRVLGALNDHFLTDGYEYYVSGFFVIKAHGVDTINNAQQDFLETRGTNTTYVESFDWRNRHGKNWMTSVKNQNLPYNTTGGGGCWIFSAIAALESHINLYYNRLLNLDLSEQAVGSCSSSGSMQTGGFPINTYDYIQQNGLVTEDCFPFANSDTLSCDSMCSHPDLTVNIFTYSTINNDANTLKAELIHNGPIASGIHTANIYHVLCLCGYGTIHAGDIVEYVSPYNGTYTVIEIPTNSELVGQTYWIYKDSGGSSANNSGYTYILFESDNSKQHTTALYYPISVSTLTTNDIICEDFDNDGYYFWGLGPKPDNCPICCPDIPDGDDSNPLLAEMDDYGNFASYSFPYPTDTISNDTLWNTNQVHCGNIIVTNNATLTITAQLTMNPAAKIIVQNGGTLVIDTGSIVNTNVDVQASAKLQLLHNGTLYLKQSGSLIVRLGAEADMEYGRVLLQ